MKSPEKKPQKPLIFEAFFILSKYLNLALWDNLCEQFVSTKKRHLELSPKCLIFREPLAGIEPATY